MKTLVKVSLRYGILGGMIGAGLLIGLYYLGRHPFLIPVYRDFRIILFAVFIFFALREIRDYQDGILYFWQGILTSFLFTAAYSVLATVILVVFMHAVPAFVADYITLTLEILKSFPAGEIERIGKDVYDSNLMNLPATNSFKLGQLHFVQSFMISLFISIILSVILRRQPKI